MPTIITNCIGEGTGGGSDIGITSAGLTNVSVSGGLITDVTITNSSVSGGSLQGFKGNVKTQASAAFTFAQADTGFTHSFTASASVEITLPKDLSVGWTVEIIQATSSGTVHLSAATGATLQNRQGHSRVNGLYGAVRLIVVANANASSAIYNLAGDTTT